MRFVGLCRKATLLIHSRAREHGATLGLVPFDECGELGARKMLEQLIEQVRNLYDCLALLVGNVWRGFWQETTRQRPIISTCVNSQYPADVNHFMPEHLSWIPSSPLSDFRIADENRAAGVVNVPAQTVVALINLPPLDYVEVWQNAGASIMKDRRGRTQIEAPENAVQVHRYED